MNSTLNWRVKQLGVFTQPVFVELVSCPVHNPSFKSSNDNTEILKKENTASTETPTQQNPGEFLQINANK